MKFKVKKIKRPFGITEEFIDEMDRALPDAKKSRIVSMQEEIDKAQTFLRENEGVVELRGKLKEAEGPTRDTLKSLRNRTKYIIEDLRKQGAI